MSSPVIRAIDVGYGHTKFVLQANERDMECGIFPSLAVVATRAAQCYGVLEKRRTHVVEADGMAFEVGPDVVLIKDSEHGSPLHENYAKSSEYLALARGALGQMNQRTIDLLMVGLPLSLMGTKRSELRQRLEGEHPLPDRGHCTIRRVRVLPQPLGGLVHHYYGDFAAHRDETNLIIDVGMFTVDWLMTHGMREIPESSGSANLGVHRILKRVAEAIGEEHHISFTDLRHVDRQLASGRIKLYGIDHDVKRHISAAQDELFATLHGLANDIGDGRTIDNVFLVGGGSSLFEPIIERILPKHRIHTVSDPVFANVRGFQLVGTAFSRPRCDAAA